jgi:nucleoside-diphosphate-sugar epimerase
LDAHTRLRLAILREEAMVFLRGWQRCHVAGGKSTLYAARCVMSIDKARLVLGYEPQMDLDRGMAATTPYIYAVYGGLMARSPRVARDAGGGAVKSRF